MLGLFWGDRAGRIGRADRRRGRAVRRGHRPAMEGLEARIALATDVWTGGGTDDNWMTAGNWMSGVIPSAGDDLDFPSTATNLTSNNNFPGNTTFNSITIGDAGYTLTGNTLNLTTGVSATYASGTSTDKIDTILMSTAAPFTVDPGATLEFQGVLSNGSSVTAGVDVTGGGTLDLQGVNKYTGTTTVASGTTLLVDGTIAAVQANGVLGGNGSVGAVTSVGGTISPGDLAPGVLTANGAVSLDSGSTFTTDIDGTSPGNGSTGYSQLVTSATGDAVSLGGATLDATVGSGYTSAVGNQLTIIKNNSGSAVSGIFAGLAEGGADTISGTLFRISYLGTTGTGQDVVLSQVSSTSTTTLSPITSPATYGQTVSLTATVTGNAGAPTGTVEFFDGSPTTGGTEITSAPVLSTGTATATTSTLSVSGSPHQIYALYIPTPTSFVYAGSTSAPDSVTVNPATLTVTGVTAENKVYDGTTTATLDTTGASLSGVVNGDDVSLNTTNASGVFVTADAFTGIPVTVSGLSLSGTASTNYVLAQPTGLTADITRAPLTLTANNQSIAQGAAIPSLTFTATGLQGTDTISVLTTQPTLSTTATSSSPAGTYPINITGGAAANYTITDVPGTLTVVTSFGTTTTLSSSSELAVAGQPVTFTATVAPVSSSAGKPTGTVFFVEGNTLLGQSALNPATGQATFTTSSLGFGSNPIVAEFLANSPFQNSESSTLTQFVTAAGTQPVVSFVPVRNKHGKFVGIDIVAQVQPTAPGGGVPPGSVTFFINGRASYQSVPLVNGTAVLTVLPQRLVNLYIYARYNGNPSYIASSSSNIYFSHRALVMLSKAQGRVKVAHHRG
jgi:hypothetical protein